MHMWEYVCVYVYVCKCALCACVCMCVFVVCIHAFVCVSMREYMCKCMGMYHMCVSVSKYTCAFVSKYVCMHVCVYMCVCLMFVFGLLYIWVYACECVYVLMYRGMWVHVCIYMFVCVPAHVCWDLCKCLGVLCKFIHGLRDSLLLDVMCHIKLFSSLCIWRENINTHVRKREPNPFSKWTCDNYHIGSILEATVAHFSDSLALTFSNILFTFP